MLFVVRAFSWRQDNGQTNYQIPADPFCRPDPARYGRSGVLYADGSGCLSRLSPEGLGLSCGPDEIRLACPGQANELGALIRQLLLKILQIHGGIYGLISDRPGQTDEFQLLGDELLRHSYPFNGEPDSIVPVHAQRTQSAPLRSAANCGREPGRGGACLMDMATIPTPEPPTPPGPEPRPVPPHDPIPNPQPPPKPPTK
jgi:hypothetical protein